MLMFFVLGGVAFLSMLVTDKRIVCFVGSSKLFKMQVFWVSGYVCWCNGEVQTVP